MAVNIDMEKAFDKNGLEFFIGYSSETWISCKMD